MSKTKTFQVGGIYYGSLACAHSSFPVRITKRTPKTVTVEHVKHPGHYATKMCRVSDSGSLGESFNFHGWFVTSNTNDTSFDIHEI